MKKKYSGRLLVTSIAVLLCGMVHLIWAKVFRMTAMLGKIKEVGDDSFSVFSVSSWAELLKSGSHGAKMHLSVLYLVIALSAVCGILGIIIAAEKRSGRDPGAFGVILVITGVLMCVFGSLSLWCAAVSGAAVTAALVMLAVTLYVIPIVFLIIAVGSSLSAKQNSGD